MLFRWKKKTLTTVLHRSKCPLSSEDVFTVRSRTAKTLNLKFNGTLHLAFHSNFGSNFTLPINKYTKALHSNFASSLTLPKNKYTKILQNPKT